MTEDAQELFETLAEDMLDAIEKPLRMALEHKGIENITEEEGFTPLQVEFANMIVDGGTLKDLLNEGHPIMEAILAEETSRLTH